ncbi:hypothetical protein OG897_17715 [Streptomyces sp. NBC_00237]|uniref:hypothetical protein n=1 Tax=Streptomyces sp. NBC_00237 TaxID=2975687 RepID=UPI002253C524|nr:hypothetical protein [Streptomyces sp. NBC_00237]MCX5203275.1 hypothetical protein [Streptomyces sp. NBC_00237]
MKRIFEVVGFLLTLWGVGGLVHEWFDWFKLWQFVDRLGWFEGYEVYANIVLAVAGIALMIASERVGRSTGPGVSSGTGTEARSPGVVTRKSPGGDGSP